MSHAEASLKEKPIVEAAQNATPSAASAPADPEPPVEETIQAQ